MTAGTDRPLWTCPNCGRSFANRNQAHACQSTTVAEYLAGKSDLAVGIYEEVVRVLKKEGEFRLHPQKSRIAFISRMTFGGVALARRWADLSFILPVALDDRRVRKLELYGPTSWGHTVRLASVTDLDEDVSAWLSDALARGNQETLNPSAHVDPLNAHQIEVFWTGFRGKVEDSVSGQVVSLPRHIVEALELAGDLTVKIGRTTTIQQVTTHVAVDRSLGYAEDDGVDVFISGI